MRTDVPSSSVTRANAGKQPESPHESPQSLVDEAPVEPVFAVYVGAS
jgi:hypothetical protein